MTTITQADIDAARAALDIPPDAATSTCGLEKHFAAYREAAEARVTGGRDDLTDRHIFNWFNERFPDEMAECLAAEPRGDHKESQP